MAMFDLPSGVTLQITGDVFHMSKPERDMIDRWLVELAEAGATPHKLGTAVLPKLDQISSSPRFDILQS